jgi:hypothetical protein
VAQSLGGVQPFPARVIPGRYAFPGTVTLTHP